MSHRGERQLTVRGGIYRFVELDSLNAANIVGVLGPESIGTVAAANVLSGGTGGELSSAVTIDGGAVSSGNVVSGNLGHHVHTESDIIGFQDQATYLNGLIKYRAPVYHTHPIEDVANILVVLSPTVLATQTDKTAAFARKALLSQLDIANVTGLQTALDSKADLASGTTIVSGTVDVLAPGTTLAVGTGSVTMPTISSLPSGGAALVYAIDVGSRREGALELEVISTTMTGICRTTVDVMWDATRTAAITAIEAFAGTTGETARLAVDASPLSSSSSSFSVRIKTLDPSRALAGVTITAAGGFDGFANPILTAGGWP